MSRVTYCPDCPSASNFIESGFSPDFEVLKKLNGDAFNEYRKAETIGRALEETLGSLMEVYNECSVDNWDGYGALPVSVDVLLEAKRLIDLLPSNMTFPMPSVTAEPNGEIALEWYKGNRLIFVVSVTDHNEIIYAGLFGTNKIHGIEYFGSSLPHVIVSNLKRLYY